MNETERMKELVKKLNEAAKAYYQEDREIMSNLEYDTLYDELQVLEEKTGVTLAGKPDHKSRLRGDGRTAERSARVADAFP